MKRFLRPAKISPSFSGQPHGIAHGSIFKRLLVAGQIGADSSGEVPAALEAQVELAFDNLLAVIDAAQLGVGDITRLIAYVVVPGSFAMYNRVRERKLGPATPVSTYVEIAGLGDPRWLFAIEGEAVRENDP